MRTFELTYRVEPFGLQFWSSKRLEPKGWRDVERAIQWVLTWGGRATLRLQLRPDAASELTLESEFGNYLLTFLSDDEDDVRALNGVDDGGQTVIGGNNWSNSVITISRSPVIRAFYELFHDGNVSSELMS